MNELNKLLCNKILENRNYIYRLFKTQMHTNLMSEYNLLISYLNVYKYESANQRFYNRFGFNLSNVLLFKHKREWYFKLFKKFLESNNALKAYQNERIQYVKRLKSYDHDYLNIYNYKINPFNYLLNAFNWYSASREIEWCTLHTEWQFFLLTNKN